MAVHEGGEADIRAAYLAIAAARLAGLPTDVLAERASLVDYVCRCQTNEVRSCAAALVHAFSVQTLSRQVSHTTCCEPPCPASELVLPCRVGWEVNRGMKRTAATRSAALLACVSFAVLLLCGFRHCPPGWRSGRAGVKAAFKGAPTSLQMAVTRSGRGLPLRCSVPMKLARCHRSLSRTCHVRIWFCSRSWAARLHKCGMLTVSRAVLADAMHLKPPFSCRFRRSAGATRPFERQF